LTEITPDGRNDFFSELSIKDYLEIVQRRKWWIILAAIGVFICTLVVVWRLPNLYRSETVILVDPQKVPENYVASTSSTNIADRLSTLQQEVLSPTRLKKVVDQMGLFPELRGKVSDQDLVRMMQKSTVVELVNQGGRQLSAFRIAFQGRDPAVTAQVANEIATLFINENLKVTEEHTVGTADFLNHELEKTKEQLDQKDAQLQSVKSKYIMDLPDSKQYHLEALSTLRAQLQAIQEKIRRDQQEKVYLQTLTASSAPTVDLDNDAGAASPFESQIQRMEAHLSELRSRYGPAYPDVRKAQAELNDLKARAAREELNAPPKPQATELSKRTIKNPVVESQMQKLNDEIAEQSKQIPALQEQINFHVSKLEGIPIFEQRIAASMRDYDTLRAHYTGLLDKKLSADMANALESRQKGERFVILDPAQVPDHPFAPNRGLLSLAGLFGGIFGGIGLAVLRELSDESVRSEKEAAKILRTRVLAGIPPMFSSQQVNKVRLRVVGALVGVTICSVALGFVISMVGGRFF
jgi:succinoglycan biosynthesis transport protein ExoP